MLDRFPGYHCSTLFWLNLKGNILSSLKLIWSPLHIATFISLQELACDINGRKCGPFPFKIQLVSLCYWCWLTKGRGRGHHEQKKSELHLWWWGGFLVLLSVRVGGWHWCRRLQGVTFNWGKVQAVQVDPQVILYIYAIRNIVYPKQGWTSTNNFHVLRQTQRHRVALNLWPFPMRAIFYKTCLLTIS